MLGYLSADVICSEWRTVFRERSSRKTVSYEEQIMSKDKYPSIFSPQMEAIVFIILQIFYATRAVLKIGEYPRIFPSFSWEIFAHVTRLDQSRRSENIGWIINTHIGLTRITSILWFCCIIRAALFVISAMHLDVLTFPLTPVNTIYSNTPRLSEHFPDSDQIIRQIS